MLAVLVIHFFILIFYLWLPWRGWEWTAKEEATKVELRGICKGIHIIIWIVLFLSPLICVGMTLGVRYFPSYVDEQFGQSFVEIGRTNVVSTGYVQAIINKGDTTAFTNSFVGVSTNQQMIMLLPTQNVVEYIIKPLPYAYVHEWAHSIALWLVLGIVGLLIIEKVVRIQNQKRDTSAPPGS